MPVHDLEVEAAQIIELLQPYHEMHDNQLISSPDYVAVFILVYLAHRKPRQWCSGVSVMSLAGIDSNAQTNSLRVCELTPAVQQKIDVNYIAKKWKKSEEEVTQTVRIVDIFNHLKLAGIKHNADHYINRFVVLYFCRKRPVRLLHYVPSPMEVLTQQAHGERVVTMFRKVEELSRCHVSKLQYMSGNQEHARDALEFLLHDIRHMEHFTSPDIYKEQVGFFASMRSINHGDVKQYFLKALGHPKPFWYELEYVLSDMNCYSTHLLRYFHAKWVASFHNKQEQRLMSTTSPDEDSGATDAVREEWRRILLEIFPPSRSESGSMDELAASTAPATEALRAEAFDAAQLLNDITERRITDLSTAQWEAIRAYFAWHGTSVLGSTLDTLSVESPVVA